MVDDNDVLVMETILVVVASDEPNESLLTEADRHVTGTESRVVLCCVNTEGFRQNSIQRRSRAGREAGEIDQHAAETAAAEIAADTFGDDVKYDVVGIADDSADEILAVADEHDCDHVFIDAQSRTAVGKAVFGDVAQQVILQFDGPVTVTTGS